MQERTGTHVKFLAHARFYPLSLASFIPAQKVLVSVYLALQENDIVVQSARSDKSSLTSDQICSLVNTRVAESIQNILPQLLSKSLQKPGLTRGTVWSNRRGTTKMTRPLGRDKQKLQRPSSQTVCDVLLASWRSSIKKRYEDPWRTWTGWSIERNKCPFSAPVKDILEFLTVQFQERILAYRTIGWELNPRPLELHFTQLVPVGS